MTQEALVNGFEPAGIPCGEALEHRDVSDVITNVRTRCGEYIRNHQLESAILDHLSSLVGISDELILDLTVEGYRIVNEKEGRIVSEKRLREEVGDLTYIEVDSCLAALDKHLRSGKELARSILIHQFDPLEPPISRDERKKSIKIRRDPNQVSGEERDEVYRTVVEHPGITFEELRELLGHSMKNRNALGQLCAKGAIVKKYPPGRVHKPRYFPTPQETNNGTEEKFTQLP